MSGLFSLWANERGLEKRSSTCRAQFSALKLCHGPLVRPFCFLSAAGALLWLVLAVGKGVRLVFLSAAGALLWFLSFSSLLPAQAREAKLLWLAAPSGPSALKAMRSRYLSTLGLLSSGAVGVVVSHPLSMREGLGSIPGLSMCACVCHSLPLPSLSSLWVCCASCQDRLVRRGRVPNVTFESYIESRKLSVPRARPARTASRPARLEAALASPQRARTKGVRRQPAPPLESYRSPGRDQQEQLRVQRAWRPHLLRRSEHEPKECAGSLLRRGRVPNVAFEWPLFAVGKRARPGKALKHLQGTVFSAEALSRPARPAFLLPFCCRRTPLVGSRCGQRSASSLPFCCRRAPLVSFLFLSAAGASAGSEAFVAGRSLWTFSAESYAQQVFERSRPAQLRGSWCSGITPAQHARGAGFNPRPVHAHVRLRLSQFASPWSFIPLGLLCVLPRPAGTPRPGAKRHF